MAAPGDEQTRFTARTASLGELTVDDFARWRRLEQHAAEPYPALSADYLEPAWPHWAEALGTRLLLVEDEDDLVLVMPFRVTTAHPKIPVPVVSTDDGMLSDEGVRSYPLIDRARGREAVRFALSRLRSLGLPAVVEIGAVPDEGEVHDLLRDAVADPRRMLVRGRSALAVARRRPDAHGRDGRVATVAVNAGTAGAPTDTSAFPDFVVRHRSAATRRKTRQRVAALERVLAAPIEQRDRSTDRTVIDEFLELQARGWKGDADRQGLAYRLTGRDEWFRHAARRLQDAGRLRAFELRSGGRTIYIALGVISGPVLFGWQDAYDEATAVHGVGALGRLAFVNWQDATGSHDMFDPNMSWSYLEASRDFPDRREQIRLLIAAPGGAALVRMALVRVPVALRRSRILERARGGIRRLLPGRR